MLHGASLRAPPAAYFGSYWCQANRAARDDVHAHHLARRAPALAPASTAARTAGDVAGNVDRAEAAADLLQPNIFTLAALSIASVA